MACVNSSSLPETTRFLGRKSQPGKRRNLISIYNFPALHFMTASSITLLAWFPNGAVSTGHPAILSITHLAWCSAIEKGRWHRRRRTAKPFWQSTSSYPRLARRSIRRGRANSPPNDPIASFNVHTRPSRDRASLEAFVSCQYAFHIYSYPSCSILINTGHLAFATILVAVVVPLHLSLNEGTALNQ